jgi:hypothetical protein
MRFESYYTMVGSAISPNRIQTYSKQKQLEFDHNPCEFVHSRLAKSMTPQRSPILGLVNANNHVKSLYRETEWISYLHILFSDPASLSKAND